MGCWKSRPRSPSFPKADDNGSANPPDNRILQHQPSFDAPDIQYIKDCFSSIAAGSESLWVYACFIAHNHQIFHAFRMSSQVSVPFPPLPTAQNFVGSATAVLDKMLYVIGGIDLQTRIARNDVFVFNPQTYEWDCAPPTIARRRYSVAAVGSNRKLFVFGGLEEAEQERNIPWAEVYDPEKLEWTAIQECPYAPSRHLPLEKALVVGDKIFIQTRNRDDALLFDVSCSSWLQLPQEFISHWCLWFPTAAVGNMLIATHNQIERQGSGPHKTQLTIQAYDTERNHWLKLVGVDERLILKKSPPFYLMSGDGKLVVYGMVDERNSGMPFIVYDIKEIDESSVEANLSWEGTYTSIKEHWNLAIPAHPASATGQ